MSPDIRLTEACWRWFPAELRRRLSRKAVIINHQVLDVARALCERGDYGLAFDLDQGLRSGLVVPHQGCGLGLLMNLQELMGEDPAPIDETPVIQY